ncbi:MAG: squalene/phytoene synthase family protein [Legionellales bacterium]|nr:squalene/phytoene synthase family protein [Legionellales bacterium]
MNQADPFFEYEQKICPRGSTLYYSLLFVDEEKKRSLVALYALHHEFTQITEHYHEKNLAQIKLQWWQQECQRMFEGKAQHPIAIALQTAVSAHELPPALFQEWVDGALLKLDIDHCCTESDLLFFCYREYGILAILSAYLLGFKQHSSLKGVQELAQSIALTQVLKKFSYHLRRDWCFLPLDWLTQQNLTVTDLQPLTLTPALTAVFKQASDLAEQKFQQGCKDIYTDDKKTLSPLFIWAAINNKTRVEMEKEGFNILTQQIDLTPLRKLFIAIRWYYFPFLVRSNSIK